MKRKVTIEVYDNAVRVVTMMNMCGAKMSFMEFLSISIFEEGMIKTILAVPFSLGSWGTSRFSFWRCNRYLRSIKEVVCTVNKETPCEFCQYKKVCPDKTKEGRNAKKDSE